MGGELIEEDFWLVFKDVLFSDEKIEVAEDEVENIIELGDLEKGQKILDMPCGIGRHLTLFEEKGFDVVGVEKTEDYVSDAKQKAESAEVVNQDMKNFKRENEFDAAINWWDSFGYFEDEQDDLQTLENINYSLKDGGVLLMDVLGKEVAASKGSGAHYVGSESLFMQNRVIKEDWNKIEDTWVRIEDGEKIACTWEQTLYSAQELRQLLEKAGFSDIEFYGGVNGEPYDHEAERMIVRARK